MKNLVQLHKMLENAQFQKIQDTLSITTGLSFVTVDYKGVPVTSHSMCTEFCKIMREGKYEKSCERCDSRGGLEAARSQSPYIYLCHAGLVDFAIPIIYEGNYLGAVMGGQVLLEDQNDNAKLEQIAVDHQKQMMLPKKSVVTASKKVAVMPLEKIRKIAEMIFIMCNSMVEEARLKQSFYELNRNRSFIHVDECFSDQYTHILKSGQPTFYSEGDRSHELLKPAFAYIRDHLSGDLSLQTVASICHVSPSYFSRIFAKQKLGSYSDYINGEKISQAKRYLKLTDLTISQIASKLSYADSGYFIKVFKKIVGVTPNEYRHRPDISDNIEQI